MRMRFPFLYRPVCMGLISALALVLLLLPAAGQADSARNYKIKAGFTYRFILFGEWPEAAFVPNQGTFTIGIIGTNPFSDFFTQAASHPVGGKRLIIRSLPAQPSLAAIRSCQIIFINSELEDELAEILAMAAGEPILTVSDIPGFIDKGGMISFFNRRNRIKFAVHRSRASKVGINFRAQMLKMAAHVLEEE